MAKISRSKDKSLNKFYKQFLNLFDRDRWYRILFDFHYLPHVSIFLLLAETILCIFIVNYVKYTEIDWKAYMQEVEGVLNGTLDYSKLKGDTGPLVYPAGFVYIYAVLYYMTDGGSNIKLAQYIFIILYVVTLASVLRLYIRSKKVPPYVLILMCFTTYRIHSIYLLRLFNDPFAVLFLYIALNLFLIDYWSTGSVFFSFAVSIKMNILLYSPALLLIYLTVLGWRRTLKQLLICATLQLILSLPFLVSNPYAYIKGSFDLGRVFFHQWTVNWRFIPEDIFIDRRFHAALLLLHVTLLLVFFRVSLTYLKSYAILKKLEGQVKKQLKNRTETVDMRTSSQLLLLPLFIANFIGVACSRSLHYQFYVWYYHSLPYLLWSTSLSVKTRLVLLGLIELSWNTYPSTYWSSGILHLSHIVILCSLYEHTRDKIKRTLNN